MAAKHEKQRQVEIRKCQEYGKSLSHSQNKSKTDDKPSDKPGRQNTNNKSQSGSNTAPGSKATNRCCYICNQSGHLAKNCKTSSKEQESKGNTSHKKDPSNTSTRQVITESSDNNSGAKDENSMDPLSFLYSDSNDTVDTVRVSDYGSKLQYVNVKVQGVPTSGVSDIGVDITIIGGELFKKVAAAARLRKRL